jgi:pSer/pThr/pTyr-binding forkhead associated (FHA) protein
MNPRLRVIAGPLKNQVVELPAGEVTVGREATNQLPISDPALSRRHCLLTLEDGRYKIRDLQSRNGTLIHERGYGPPADSFGIKQRLRAAQ